jgi:hypothetical protein
MALYLEDFFQGDTVRVRAVYPAGTDLTGYIHYLVLKANDSDAEPALYAESTFGDHTADLEYAAATPASPGVPATPEVLPTAYVEAAPEVTDMISSGKYLYRVGIDDTGVIRYIGNDASPTFRAEVSSSIPVNDGQPHHVVIAHDGNTSLRCYVDGVDVTTGPAIVYAGGIVVQYIGAAMGTTSDYNFTGEMSDVAFFTQVLTAAEVATLYGLGAGALAESTGTRLTRILDAVGWPASWRDQTITSGLRGECYELSLTGKSALAAGQEVADTEQGGLYCTPTNKAPFC